MWIWKGVGYKDKKEKRKEGEKHLGLSGVVGVVGFDLISLRKERKYEERGGLKREEWKRSKKGNGDMYQQCTINFQTFFLWALLLIVHSWNSSPLRSNLLRLQCISCTVPTTSGKPNRSPLVLACQWPFSQPLSSPQLSHNDSL